MKFEVRRMATQYFLLARMLYYLNHLQCVQSLVVWIYLVVLLQDRIVVFIKFKSSRDEMDTVW